VPAEPTARNNRFQELLGLAVRLIPRPPPPAEDIRLVLAPHHLMEEAIRHPLHTRPTQTGITSSSNLQTQTDTRPTQTQMDILPLLTPMDTTRPIPIPTAILLLLLVAIPRQVTVEVADSPLSHSRIHHHIQRCPR